MDHNKFWDTIDKNCQRIAERDELVEEGESFQLTPDQLQALENIDRLLNRKAERMILKGPTGCGKTEVFMRMAIAEHLAFERPVWILAPTRDLLRQHQMYIEQRLEGTEVAVASIHGGIPPKDRDFTLEKIRRAKAGLVLASAMVLEQSKYRELMDDAALVVVDDVHAFDETEHLHFLKKVRARILYTTATPEAVAFFLRREGAMANLVEMKAKPFNAPSTKMHREPGSLGESVFGQLDRAVEIIKKHLNLKSRIYVISRTRMYVPMMADYLERQLDVPVSLLHGDMADTQEHRKRMKRFNGKVAEDDRSSMMARFRKNSPAILVATNLIGSGLDIPMADLIVITDADSFGEPEVEQLVGRVGRRERESDAFLITGTDLTIRGGATAKGTSTIREGRMIISYRPRSGAMSRRGR